MSCDHQSGHRFCHRAAISCCWSFVSLHVSVAHGVELTRQLGDIESNVVLALPAKIFDTGLSQCRLNINSNLTTVRIVWLNSATYWKHDCCWSTCRRRRRFHSQHIMCCASSARRSCCWRSFFGCSSDFVGKRTSTVCSINRSGFGEGPDWN